MLEGSSMYLHSMVELVKDPFQFSGWCAMYRAIWDPFKKNNSTQIYNIYVYYRCSLFQ